MPAITSISPNAGFTYGEIKVTITSVNLANATAVTLDGQRATNVQCTPTQCMALAPVANERLRVGAYQMTTPTKHQCPSLPSISFGTWELLDILARWFSRE